MQFMASSGKGFSHGVEVVAPLLRNFIENDDTK